MLKNMGSCFGDQISRGSNEVVTLWNAPPTEGTKANLNSFSRVKQRRLLHSTSQGVLCLLREVSIVL